MIRRDFVTRIIPGATVLMMTDAASAGAPEPLVAVAGSASRPKVLFFDVNETLLDLNAMRAGVAKALGGRPDLVPLWFTTMLQYTLVDTVGGQYHDFGAVGVATMMMVARNHGISLSEDEARTAVKPIRSLPPHADAAPALKALQEAGFRMATLTNSSRATVDAQIGNAGLKDLFEDRLSIEDILLFKPHAHAYRWAAHKMGARPDECMLIAAHGWDIAGALWAGLRAAFLSRPGAQLYPLAPAPEIVEPDLSKAAGRLIQMESQKG
jgi:2-haloacid dehalogenase